MLRDPWRLRVVLIAAALGASSAGACGLNFTVSAPSSDASAEADAAAPDGTLPDAPGEDTSVEDAARPPCDDKRTVPGITFAPEFAAFRAYTFILPTELARTNRGGCLVENDTLRVVRGLGEGPQKITSYRMVRGTCGRIDHLGKIESELDAPGGHGGLARVGEFLLVSALTKPTVRAFAPGKPPRDVAGFNDVPGYAGSLLITGNGHLVAIRDGVEPSSFYRFRLTPDPGAGPILAGPVDLARMFSGAAYSVPSIGTFKSKGRALLLVTHSPTPNATSTIEIVRTDEDEDPEATPEPFATPVPNTLGLCFDPAGKAVLSVGFEGPNGYLIEGF